MEPSIQYAKTSDGVTIAYYAIGQGLPFVWIELPSHLQAEWRFPEQRRAYETVSGIGTLVRYDHRGFGLSDRDISEFPLDALVKDLEAVVDKLALDTFVPFAAGGFAAPVAIGYAAAHPERVSQLVLGGGFARIPPQIHQYIQALMLPGSDWRFVSESIVRLALGWEEEEFSRQVAAFWREASTFDTFKIFWRDIGEWDVRNLLPSIVAPTLLSNMQENPLAGPEQLREMASLMPDARAVIADGATYQERSAQYQAAIASFLFGPNAVPAASAAVTVPQGTAVILFADIVDSTALTERLGDTAFRDKARDLDGSLRAIIREAGGTPVEGKLLGDGVLAVFASARQAIEAALACGRSGGDAGLPLHLGLHAGDVIREENNVYGGAVNIASRISALSAPGEVLVSETVRSLARTSAGVSFEDRGERELKGVGEPVRVWSVRAGD